MSHPELSKNAFDPLKPLELLKTRQRQRRFTRALLWVAGWRPEPPARHPQQDSGEPQSGDESGKSGFGNFFKSSG